MHLDDKQIRALAHDVSWEFVAHHNPDELLFFDAIWRQLHDHDCTHEDLPTHYALAGLPFAADAAAKLITPVAVIAVLTTIVELNQEGISLPEPQEIADALKQCAQRLGANATVLERLESFALPLLADTLGGLESATTVRSVSSSSNPQLPLAVVVVAVCQHDNLRAVASCRPKNGECSNGFRIVLLA